MPNSFRSKAQGLSLNTIIIAVIAIAVLVVVLIIFGTRTRSVSTDMGGCGAKGGTCMSVAEGARCPSNMIDHGTSGCPAQEGSAQQRCCQPFGSSGSAPASSPSPSSPTGAKEG